jgi:hypothetical protein
VSEVAGEVTPPGGSDGDDGLNVAGFGGASEPLTTRVVPGLDGVSTDWGVIVTNLLLAIILLITLLTSSAIFNETTTEHRADLQDILARLVAPFQSIIGAVQGLWPSGGAAGTFIERLLGPVLVLGIAAGIYSFSNPDIGLNDETALLFMSLILSMAILTYLAEGGEALMTHRRFGVPAAVRLYPAALFFAIGFTVLSRAVDFQAPIMFGFIATATVLTAAGMEQRHSATAVLIPSLVLLAISIGAWFLLDPLRDAVDSTDWWAQLPSVTAALVFVGGIEGLLFVMIPLSFTDGSKLFRWYRPFWLVLFAVPAFFFCWAILNPQAAELDAILQRRVIFIVSLVAAYATFAFLFWAYFRARAFRNASE